jgi:hypothetical protein
MPANNNPLSPDDVPLVDLSNQLHDIGADVKRIAEAVTRNAAPAMLARSGGRLSGAALTDGEAEDTGDDERPSRFGQAARAGLRRTGQLLRLGVPLGAAARGGLATAATSLGPVGIALATVTAGAAAAGRSLNELSKNALAHSEQLARASANMALVQAERTVRELFRQREIGDRLSGSARALAESEQFVKDQSKEINILFAEVSNRVSTAWNYFTGEVMGVLNTLAGIGNGLLGNTDPKNQNLTFGEWAEGIADQDRRDRRNRPRDFDDAPQFPRRPFGEL